MSDSKPKAKIGRPPKKGGALTVSERSRAYRRRKAGREVETLNTLCRARDILLDLIVGMMLANQSLKGLPRLLADALEEQPDALLLVRAALAAHRPHPVHQRAMLAHIDRIIRQVKDDELEEP